jgi:hypothetical protein
MIAFRAGSFLLLLAWAASPAAAQGQATLRGVVVAAADGSGIPAAAVTLSAEVLAEPRHVPCGPTGEFVAANLPPGDYAIVAEGPGFAREELRLTLLPREVRTVRVELPVAGVEIEVQVSETAARVSGTHSPSATTLTAERLARMPLAARTSMPEAIVTAAPGMIRGHDNLVHVRGNEQALNTFINGVSFWENPHAVFSAGLSPDVFQIANVMTGGFPAEYGNRFGGVLDVVTKSGFTMQQDGSVTVGTGEAGRHNVALDYGTHVARTALYLFGAGFRSERFLNPPDPQAFHDTAGGAHGLVQFDALRGERDSFRMLLMVDGSNFEIPQTAQDVELRPDAKAVQQTRQQTAILSWSHAASNETLMSVSLYERWSRSELEPAHHPLAASAAAARELLTLGAKADLHRHVGRHAIKGGLDVVRLRPSERIDYQYGGYRVFTHLLGLPHIHIAGNRIAFSGRDAGGSVGVYVQDAWQASDRLTLDLGLRFDRFSLVTTASQVSPRLNAAYRIGNATLLHASFNRLFVPPPIEHLLASSAGLTEAIGEIGFPLPALPASRETQIEAGVSRLLRSGARAVATAYYRATDDPVHTTIWPDSRIYTYASFDRARAWGLESRLDVPVVEKLGLSAYLNYALGRVHFYGPVTGGFIAEPEHIADAARFLAPMDQTHTLAAGLAYRHPSSGFWAGVTAEYGSGTPMGHGDEGHDHAEGEEDDHSDVPSDSGSERVPSHVVANLSAGLDLLRGTRGPRLSLQVNAENVGNRVYKVAQESAFAAGEFSIPRLFSVSLTVRF